jgi:hypothetical protein
VIARYDEMKPRPAGTGGPMRRTPQPAAPLINCWPINFWPISMQWCPVLSDIDGTVTYSASGHAEICGRSVTGSSIRSASPAVRSALDDFGEITASPPEEIVRAILIGMLMAIGAKRLEGAEVYIDTLVFEPGRIPPTCPEASETHRGSESPAGLAGEHPH